MSCWCKERLAGRVWAHRIPRVGVACFYPSNPSAAALPVTGNTVARNRLGAGHMPNGSCSLSQLFLALCVATGLAAACVLLATAEPLASTPAELRGGSAGSRRLSRGVNRDSSGRPSTLRRLSGAAKGRRHADGPPPAGITVSYTPEEGYRSQEGQDKWVDQQIFGGKRCLSMIAVARAAIHCSRSPLAGPGLLPGPERRAPAAWMPKSCRRRSPPLRASRHGTFVDLGCYDGVTYSNTWYFETKLGWSGVCVEPELALRFKP